MLALAEFLTPSTRRPKGPPPQCSSGSNIVGLASEAIRLSTAHGLGENWHKALMTTPNARFDALQVTGCLGIAKHSFAVRFDSGCALTANELSRLQVSIAEAPCAAHTSSRSRNAVTRRMRWRHEWGTVATESGRLVQPCCASDSSSTRSDEGREK